MIESIGNKVLYSMGFDGACIGTLMKLSPEQVEKMVKELDKLRDNNNNKKKQEKTNG